MYKTNNKFSENCIDPLLAGFFSWIKTSDLRSQIEVAIFASLLQEKFWETKLDFLTIFRDSTGFSLLGEWRGSEGEGGGGGGVPLPNRKSAHSPHLEKCPSPLPNLYSLEPKVNSPPLNNNFQLKLFYL